jgi:two-component system chemotaxis response regulator CheY
VVISLPPLEPPPPAHCHASPTSPDRRALWAASRSNRTWHFRCIAYNRDNPQRPLAEEEVTVRLLVVDDSSTMRRIIRNSLKTLGFEDIVEAENGENALSRLQAEQVDFVITDWNMPVMSGIELVTAMRGNPTLKATPVLMVTTVAEKDEILKAMQAGVTNYVVKPFDAATLKKKIDQILAA